MESQIDKIERLKLELLARNLSTLIEVDGGINGETVQQCQSVDVVVAGSFIFGKKDRKAAIESLRRRGK